MGNRAKKKLNWQAKRAEQGAGSKEGVQYPLGSLRSRIFFSLFPTKEPGPRLLLSKSRVCSKLTSIWLKSRVWYRVSSKSSVPSFEYRVLTKSSATSCGSHRVLPRLEYRVLSTESSAPSFGSNRVLPRLKHRVLTKSSIECICYRVDNHRVLFRLLPRNGERSDNCSHRQFFYIVDLEIVYDFSMTRAACAIKIACDNRKAPIKRCMIQGHPTNSFCKISVRETKLGYTFLNLLYDKLLFSYLAGDLQSSEITEEGLPFSGIREISEEGLPFSVIFRPFKISASIF